ncbi:MAG TPA: aldo/keto reductase [Myxococcales bacterium]|nr:aldo/keto reductase [Myxococcales bacterium]
MEPRALGAGGPLVPVIGQGTWKMERDDPQAAVEALRRGFELGLTHVDTAEMYGMGHVEEVLARALEGWRDKIFLVSKVLPQNASFAGTVKSCESSLRRLETDRLDCYLLHWHGPHPFGETLRAFEQLQQEGKIRSYGVSNFDVEDLEEAVALAGPGKIACNQVLYHLKERAIEHALLPRCQALGVAVVGYSPFGAGEFPAAGSAGGKVLREIARERGVSPYAVALRFLVREPLTFTIPKAASVSHVEENAAAGALELTGEEVASIDAAFPRGAERPLPLL